MNNKISWNKRQQVIIALTVITFVILIWQIYTLVRSDMVPQHDSLPTLPAAPSAAVTTPNSSAAAPSPASNTDMPNNIAANTAATVPNTSLNPVNPTDDNKLAFANSSNPPAAGSNNAVSDQNNTDAPQEADQLPEQTINSRAGLGLDQHQYMNIANQYELAKMQRRLLEEQVAIANAKHSIADTDQQTAKIMGTDTDLAGDNDPSTLRLTYLSQLSGEWHATIARGSSYYDIVIGTKLIDGTEILNIDKKGVTLRYKGELTTLTFAGANTHIVADNHDETSTDNTQAPATQPHASTPAVPITALPKINSAANSPVTPLKETITQSPNATATVQPPKTPVATAATTPMTAETSATATTTSNVTTATPASDSADDSAKDKIQ